MAEKENEKGENDDEDEEKEKEEAERLNETTPPSRRLQRLTCELLEVVMSSRAGSCCSARRGRRTGLQ